MSKFTHFQDFQAQRWTPAGRTSHIVGVPRGTRARQQQASDPPAAPRAQRLREEDTV